MRFQLLRLPTLLVLALVATTILPADAILLRAGTIGNEGLSPLSGAATKVAHIVKKKKKKRGKKSRKRSRRSSRRYTLRGNPEVTRRVASQLIVEKLPELAQLVGLEAAAPLSPVEGDVQAETTTGAAESASVSVADAPTAGTIANASITDRSSGISAIPTTGVAASAPAIPDYSDSELSEEEDPDRLSMEDEEMLEDEDDLTIDEFYEEFTSYMASLNGDADMYVTDNGVDKIVAMETLMDWLGTRYLFGGTSRNGIDCSAFTRTVYGSLGCPLPRTAAMQWDAGDEIAAEDLQFGDLVFFHTRSGVYVSHVGMYLGNDMFAHASSRNGVTVSSLGSDYYSTHFIGARRFDVAGAKAEAALEQETETAFEAEDVSDTEAVATRTAEPATTQVQ